MPPNYPDYSTMPSPSSAPGRTSPQQQQLASPYNSNNHHPPNESILLQQLQGQIEFYFSPENLGRDTYLQSLLNSRDHYGAVPLATISSFPKVKELYAMHVTGGQYIPAWQAMLADPRVVGAAMTKSTTVKVSDDGHWLIPVNYLHVDDTADNKDGATPLTSPTVSPTSFDSGQSATAFSSGANNNRNSGDCNSSSMHPNAGSGDQMHEPRYPLAFGNERAPHHPAAPSPGVSSFVQPPMQQGFVAGAPYHQQVAYSHYGQASVISTTGTPYVLHSAPQSNGVYPVGSTVVHHLMPPPRMMRSPQQGPSPTSVMLPTSPAAAYPIHRPSSYYTQSALAHPYHHVQQQVQQQDQHYAPSHNNNYSDEQPMQHPPRQVFVDMSSNPDDNASNFDGVSLTNEQLYYYHEQQQHEAYGRSHGFGNKSKYRSKKHMNRHSLPVQDDLDPTRNSNWDEGYNTGGNWDRHNHHSSSNWEGDYNNDDYENHNAGRTNWEHNNFNISSTTWDGNYYNHESGHWDRQPSTFDSHNREPDQNQRNDGSNWNRDTSAASHTNHEVNSANNSSKPFTDSDGYKALAPPSLCGSCGSSIAADVKVGNDHETVGSAVAEGDASRLQSVDASIEAKQDDSAVLQSVDATTEAKQEDSAVSGDAAPLALGSANVVASLGVVEPGLEVAAQDQTLSFGSGTLATSNSVESPAGKKGGLAAGKASAKKNRGKGKPKWVRSPKSETTRDATMSPPALSPSEKSQSILQTSVSHAGKKEKAFRKSSKATTGDQLYTASMDGVDKSATKDGKPLVTMPSATSSGDHASNKVKQGLAASKGEKKLKTKATDTVDDRMKHLAIDKKA
jgi:hypothetical protein